MILNMKLVLTILKLSSAGSRDFLQANYDIFHIFQVLKIKKLL